MNEKIHKLILNGQPIHPATTTDAIILPDLKVPLSDLIWEYNISRLYPNSGIDGGNTYNISLAVTIFDMYLSDGRKYPGVTIGFISDTPGNPFIRYEFMGGSFTDPGRWSLVGGDSRSIELNSFRDLAVDVRFESDGTGIPGGSGRLIGDKLILTLRNIK